MPRDFRGRPIKVGSRIVYPGRHASHLWMSEGTVEGIVAHNTVRGGEKYSLRVRVTSASNLLGVDKPRLVTISVLQNVVVLEDSNDRT